MACKYCKRLEGSQKNLQTLAANLTSVEEKLRNAEELRTKVKEKLRLKKLESDIKILTEEKKSIENMNCTAKRSLDILLKDASQSNCETCKEFVKLHDEQHKAEEQASSQRSGRSAEPAATTSTLQVNSDTTSQSLKNTLEEKVPHNPSSSALKKTKTYRSCKAFEPKKLALTERCMNNSKDMPKNTRSQSMCNITEISGLANESSHRPRRHRCTTAGIRLSTTDTVASRMKKVQLNNTSRPQRSSAGKTTMESNGYAPQQSATAAVPVVEEPPGLDDTLESSGVENTDVLGIPGLEREYGPDDNLVISDISDDEQQDTQGSLLEESHPPTRWSSDVCLNKRVHNDFYDKRSELKSKACNQMAATQYRSRSCWSMTDKVTNHEYAALNQRNIRQNRRLAAAEDEIRKLRKQNERLENECRSLRSELDEERCKKEKILEEWRKVESTGTRAVKQMMNVADNCYEDETEALKALARQVPDLVHRMAWKEVADCLLRGSVLSWGDYSWLCQPGCHMHDADKRREIVKRVADYGIEGIQQLYQALCSANQQELAEGLTLHVRLETKSGNREKNE